MKLKKAKKIEASLVAVLEFVRCVAASNAQVTAEVLQKMGMEAEDFAPCVNRLVKLAMKTADLSGARIVDVLKTLRQESEKRRKAGKNPNVYADNEDNLDDE